MRDLILGESLDALLDYRGKTPKKMGADFTEDGVPVASAILVDNGTLDLSSARFVSHETYTKWMSTPTRSGDVLLTSEAPLGRVARVPSDAPLVLGQRLFGLRGREGLLDNAYLYYALQTERVRADLLGRSTGTTVFGIRQSALRNVRIPAPSFSEQQAIAEALGALDDKIAANSKLARTSDELASTLFHNSLRRASWSEHSFADVATVSGGGTPSTKVSEYWGGEISWATPTDVTGLEGPYLTATSRRISTAGLSACSSGLYKPGAILMTSRATIGAFAVTVQPTAVNQGFIVVEPIDPSLKWWLFHEMRSRVDEFVSLANGATFLELSRGNFRRLKVRAAEETTMIEFGVRAGSLHGAALAALEENHTLAATRDALLPQLMSGKLRVKDAERDLEGVL